MKNTQQQRNKIKTISIICFAIILVLVSTFIVWGANIKYNPSQDPKDNNPIKTIDKYLGWKSYCSKEGGLCLKYPSDWVVNDTSDATAVTITNQPKTVQIVYNPSVTSIGGSCEINTCFFRTISINNLSGTGTTNLKTIEGIFTNNATGSILAQYFVGSNERMSLYNLKVNEKVDVGFFAPFLSSPLNQNVIEQLRIKPLPDNGFSSENEATVWLSESDVKMAGNILESVYTN